MKYVPPAEVEGYLSMYTTLVALSRVSRELTETVCFPFPLSHLFTVFIVCIKIYWISKRIRRRLKSKYEQCNSFVQRIYLWNDFNRRSLWNMSNENRNIWNANTKHVIVISLYLKTNWCPATSFGLLPSIMRDQNIPSY